MTKRRDPKVTIQEIILACENSMEFIKEITFEEFLIDIKSQSAIQHQILIMGEAVKRLSPEIKTSHPEIPWKNIAGTRDVLIHCYEEADFEIIWNIVTNQLPQIHTKLKSIINNLG